MATRLENLEKSGNLKVVRENRKSQGKVSEDVLFLHARNLANGISGKSLKLLPPDVRFLG